MDDKEADLDDEEKAERRRERQIREADEEFKRRRENRMKKRTQEEVS